MSEETPMSQQEAAQWFKQNAAELMQKAERQALNYEATLQAQQLAKGLAQQNTGKADLKRADG
jgi:hypothetical protein